MDLQQLWRDAYRSDEALAAFRAALAGATTEAVGALYGVDYGRCRLVEAARRHLDAQARERRRVAVRVAM